MHRWKWVFLLFHICSASCDNSVSLKCFDVEAMVARVFFCRIYGRMLPTTTSELSCCRYEVDWADSGSENWVAGNWLSRCLWQIIFWEDSSALQLSVTDGRIALTFQRRQRWLKNAVQVVIAFAGSGGKLKVEQEFELCRISIELYSVLQRKTSIPHNIKNWMWDVRSLNLNIKSLKSSRSSKF